MTKDEEDLYQHIQTLIRSIDSLVQTITAQTQTTITLTQIIAAGHQDHEHRLRTVENVSTVLKERLGVWQVIQVAFTTIAAVVAGWFGASK